MRKIIAFVHMSLDGFVAGPNGEMNWIKINQEIFDHVGQRIGQGDMAMYGRVTFQMMENYWPNAGTKPNATKHDIEHSAWYNKVHKVVLSKTLNGDGLSNATVIADNLMDRIQEIKQADGADILVFGSPSATHALLKDNLIDGYWIFVNPVVLGEGIPMFKDIQKKSELKLVSTHAFDCGVVELNYVAID